MKCYQPNLLEVFTSCKCPFANFLASTMLRATSAVFRLFSPLSFGCQASHTWTDYQLTRWRVYRYLGGRLRKFLSCSQFAGDREK
jgi:hypothetical protein